MHPQLVLAAALVGGGAVVGGAYAATTVALDRSAATSASGGAVGGQFQVVVCVKQTTLVHVPDAQCIAAAKADPAKAVVAWRYVPSSMSAPTDVPPVNVAVEIGTFIDDPATPRYTQDALDVYGRPPVQDRSTRTGIMTRNGTIL